MKARPQLGRPRLLIVGCGDIGTRIVACLAKRFRIMAVIRRPEAAGPLRQLGAIPLLANLDDPDTLTRLRGLAPSVLILAPTSAQGTRDRRSRHLQHALLRSPAALTQRWVYMSTTGVYGDRQGRWTDETTTPNPINDRARRRLDAERTLRHRAPFATVIRAPGIYAADRLPLERIRQSLPVPEHTLYTNHIHADDLARITVRALLQGARGRVYNAVDDTDMSLQAYLDCLADHFALPRPPRANDTELRAQLTPARLSFMQESRRIQNRRLKHELKLRLHYAQAQQVLSEL